MLIVLLCMSLGLTLYGAFNKSTAISVIGAFLSFIISIYRAYKSFQNSEKMEMKLDSADEALGIIRDSKWNVTETALDWEEF